MKPPSRGEEPNTDQHDDNTGTQGMRPDAPGLGDGAHDHLGIPLSAAEQRRFHELTAPLSTLHTTRSRWLAFFGRDRACLLGGVLGIVLSVATLGILPLVVPFAGFVLALAAFATLSRNATDAGWWRRARQLLGPEVSDASDPG